eukprot:s429_g18.t1
MAGHERTLDVVEPQVLVHYEHDPHLTEHHRLLLVKVTAGRWIAASPDHELALLDLNTSRHVVLRRNSEFPQHLIADAYIFDPIARADLERLRQEAKIMAMVLNDEDMEEIPAHVWVFSDPASSHLGVEVPLDILPTAVTLERRGLVEYQGSVEGIEEIPQSELKSYPETRKGTLGDLRLIGNHADASGKRFISLQDAFPLFKESSMADWGFSGPRAVKEYLQSIREASNDLASYHLQWLQHSGANPRTALVHEHRNILEVLRLTQTGAASTRALDLWLTEQLKEKAQIQKQTRLFREEMGHGTRGQNQQHEDGASGSGGVSWRRKAKKAAAKAKSAGAQSSGAADS